MGVVRDEIEDSEVGGDGSVGSPIGLLADRVARLQTELNRADRLQAGTLGVGGAEDLQILRLLLTSGQQRVGVIARARGTSMTTASGRIDRLERRGLVRRERVDDDRRATVVNLTPAGTEAATASFTDRLAALAPFAEHGAIDILDQLIGALRELSESP